jgi:8-oxo-dGTP pyrophosphatase MutT (NUDIX family)
MKEKTDIHKAGGVLIRDRHFLVTRSYGKDVFIAPGGKLEDGESIVDALVREMMEELQIVVKSDEIEELGTFYAQAAGKEGVSLRMDVFIVHNTSEPVPSSEIEEMKWINSQTVGVKLGSIFEHDVMPILKQRNLID